MKKILTRKMLTGPVRLLLSMLTAAVMLSSCGVAKQVPYFQDVLSDTALAVLPEPEPIILKPEDKISVLVNSRDPQLMSLFNLPVRQRYIGNEVNANTSNND